MPKINQLSFAVANLIAAGEVVERPASVVKELLENAIDAHATALTVEIARGGVTLIRVADNGVGMSEEDLPLAIRRHATSKIATAEDLSEIATLGFRGEALAATAAVSTLTIITKTKEAPSGTMLTAVAGEVQEISEVGCADGTTVTVEELFANVPARRKFLKKDMTETAAVTAVVEKIAMSRPDIAIRYITDGITRFSTAGDGVLSHTLYALYGRELASRLLPVEGSVGEVSVKGYIGRPDNARANRGMQNFFINERYVKSKTVGAALERAFTSYMAPERFPVAILFLSLPHFAVDVNVHPAKLEVKFENERAVFEAVYYAVRTALEESVSRPSLGLDTKTKAGRDFVLAHSFEAPSPAKQIQIEEATATVPKMPPPLRPAPAVKPVPPAVRETEPFTLTVASHSEKKGEPTLSPADSLALCERYAEAKREAERFVTKAPVVAPKEEKPPQEAQPAEQAPAAVPHTILGVAFHTYIFVELSEERLLVIDQHAAHERILFEDIKRRRAGADILCVPLLIPISVEATATECAYARAESEAFSRLGFTYSVAEGVVHLTAIPADISPAEAKDLFLSLCEGGEAGSDPAVAEEMRREKLLYQIACKAAIKGGRSYDSAHIEWLVSEVLRLPDITVCPHGRPIAFYLNKKDLDKQFDRIK